MSGSFGWYKFGSTFYLFFIEEQTVKYPDSYVAITNRDYYSTDLQNITETKTEENKV